MHTNVILTNKRRTHAQSNYTITNTKLKAWFPWTGSVHWCLVEGERNGDLRRLYGPYGSGKTLRFSSLLYESSKDMYINITSATW